MNNQTTFSVFLDCSRNGVMSVPALKKYIDYISKFGYTQLQLYMEDVYEVNNEPYFGYMRGRYSVYEIKEVDNYAKSKGIELVPAIQTLAHLESIFHWEEYQSIKDYDDILLIDEDRTYQLIDNMFASIRKMFSSNWINIGEDEAHMMGLGKYLDKHGPTNRVDLFKKHLSKVLEIANKYNFKCMMWSDMFFRLEGAKNYYDDNIKIKSNKIDYVTPIYWDYYHTDIKDYNRMFKLHEQLSDEFFFAGGVWSWSGFSPLNNYTLKILKPAMKSARNHNAKNIIMTCWGDDGKEGSYFTVLPTLFAAKQLYDGETKMSVIKDKFYSITGIKFDHMMSLGDNNVIDIDKSKFINPQKALFYSDLFNNFNEYSFPLEYKEEYKKIYHRLNKYSKDDNEFSYLFSWQAKLASLLYTKYDLSNRIRSSYQAKDNKGLETLLKDIKTLIRKTKEFYIEEKNMWNKENKPQGFDMLDMRFGGLILRYEHIYETISSYLNNKIDNIPELEGNILPLNTNNKKETTYRVNWWKLYSVNKINN